MTHADALMAATEQALEKPKPLKTYGPGIHYDVPFAEYITIDAINGSTLAEVLKKTAGHAKAQLDVDTAPLKFGRLLHLAILEPASFETGVRCLPPKPPNRPSDKQRNAANKSESTLRSIAFWDAWNADPREEISVKEKVDLQGMMGSIRRNQCINYVTGGQAEVTMVWVDKRTGLLCKGRLDFLQKQPWADSITDIKSSADLVRADKWRRTVENFWYHLKAAFYVDGYETLTGEKPFFTWLAIEKSAPYFSKPWQMDTSPEGLTYRAGQNLYRKALDIWAECLKTNQWPAYGDEVEEIELDDYQLGRAGVSRYEVPQPKERSV